MSEEQRDSLVDSTSWVLTVFGSYVGFLFLVQVALFLCERVYVFLSDLGLCASPFDLPAKPIDRGMADKKVALTYDTPLTKYEMFKFVLMYGSGLAIFRLVGVVVSFVWSVIFTIASTNFEKDSTGERICYNLIHASAHSLMFFLGFYAVRRVGTLESTKTKILISNHVSITDIVLAVSMMIPSSVSRVENLGVPLFKHVIKACDVILVDRDSDESKQRAAEELQRRAKVPNAKMLLMFSEGTTANQHALFKFQKGAFLPGEPVQLMAIRYPYKYFNNCFTSRLIGGLNPLDVMLRLACQFVNRVEVKFLPTYHPTDAERKDAGLYAAHMQKVLASHLGIPTTDATYRDYQMLREEHNRRHTAAPHC